MGRTLHYKILCDRTLLDAAWPDIERIQDAMNRDFSWTCEQLFLEVFSEADQVERAVYIDREWPGPSAWGFTKVRDDEWNAMLVFRFCQWLSQRIPEATVKLHDEGDLVLAGSVLFLNGAVTLDERSTRRNRRPRLSTAPDGTAEYRDFLGPHRRHVFLRHVPATEYAEVPEIKAMGLSEGELAQLGVHEVAMRTRFPWEPTDAAAERP